MPRETFLADATDIVRYNAPGPTAQDWWWSVAFKHPLYPGRMCVMFSGDGEEYEWYANLLLKEVDNAYEIVAESSHLAWMDIEDFLHGKETMLDKVSKLCGRPVRRPDCACQETDGFLHESFQEYAPKDYCSTGCIDLASDGRQSVA
jgi:hypothetical protein